MSNSLVKIRLSNCRNIKPFWADLEDVNSAFIDINQLIGRYICITDRLSIREFHNLILFHQLPSYKVPGYAVKEHIIKDPCTKRLRKIYGKYGKRYFHKRYVTNTKIDYWAKYGIHPVPFPKVICNQNKLKDPSGINPINKRQMQNILIENCFGTFYQNTLNYAKYFDGWDIHLHANVCLNTDGEYEYMMNLSPKYFLRLIYSIYQVAEKFAGVEKRILRNILNSMYGRLGSAMSLPYTDYLNLPQRSEFGKFIIEGETSEMEYRKEIPLCINETCNLIDEVKSFIHETGITKEHHINITFTNIPKEEK